jgi:hypothetical protein
MNHYCPGMEAWNARWGLMSGKGEIGIYPMLVDGIMLTEKGAVLSFDGQAGGVVVTHCPFCGEEFTQSIRKEEK